ncbi:MAG: hypothetical protein JO372_22900 [Solirubrobacterales bacterium]|nr:hypothetical protein [Solirubrobacterales bacterium]
MPIETETTVAETFALPGEDVFPESIGVDPATGDAYVGSLANGTLYRLRSGGEAEIWSPAGDDDRGSVAGVKVDPQRRLWAAGGYDGTLFVYELSSRVLLGRLQVSTRPSCVNDIALAAGGEAYVTDSFISLLFKATAEPEALEPYIDLAQQGVPWSEGLNFNGIVVSADGRHLVACQTNLGRFWQVTLDTRQVREVELEGGPLEHCDGMALSGSTLYVAINARNRIAVIELSDDGASGHVRALLRSDAFAFPTAVAVHDGRLLVVNGQLDQVGGSPRLPFTVVAIPADA